VKVLYVTTISDTINAFLIPHIEMLIGQGHQVDVACHVYQEPDDKLKKMGCAVFDIPFDRSPIKLQNYKAYKKLKEVISSQRYDIVHTHTPVASACVRLACRKMENVKVIYTAHGFHFYKGAPLINWLTYYPVELWLARYTDVLITINKEDYLRAIKSFKADKIKYIPGVGINVEKFRDVEVNKVLKRKEFGIPEDAFLILSVGELNKNKNHEIIIKALSRLRKSDIYYVICGKGKLEGYLKQIASNLELENNVIFSGFQSKMPEIIKTADLFAFPSKREGLPVSLMEALTAGLPVVCTRIRGNIDLVEKVDFVSIVEPDDLDGFSQAIEMFYDSIKSQSKTQSHSTRDMTRYSMDNVLRELKNIYDEITNIQITKVDNHEDRYPKKS